MKKPLTLVPPAQAEALYDAALHDARRGTWAAPRFPAQPSANWEARDWDEDDAPLLPEGRQRSSERALVSAHD